MVWVMICRELLGGVVVRKRVRKTVGVNRKCDGQVCQQAWSGKETKTKTKKRITSLDLINDTALSLSTPLQSFNIQLIAHAQNKKRISDSELPGHGTKLFFPENPGDQQ